MLAKPKIVLLFPNPLPDRGYSLEMPLSILAVAAPLHAAGYEVVLLDERLCEEPEIDLIEAAEDALCVGVSTITGYQLRRSLQLSRVVKGAYPDMPVIWGGYHPSLLPDQCAGEKCVDAVVRGQGEQTFMEIVAALESGESFHGIAGVTFRADDGAVVSNQDRPLQPLFSFPPPPYHLLDMEKFFSINGGRRALQYLSSQGCPCHCAFCVEPKVYGKWSARTAEQMVDDLADLDFRYSLSHVSFADANFFADPRRIEQFCRLMMARGLDISWSGTARADQAEKISPELSALMREAGCSQVAIGIESGSQKILDYINKKTTPEKALRSNRILQDSGIQGVYAFMVGFPRELDESESEIHETLRLIKKLRREHRDIVTLTFFVTPYPGTPIFDLARDVDLRMPKTTEDWVDWESTSVSTTWISDEDKDLVERCNNFYFPFAYPNDQIRKRMRQLKWKPMLYPLHWISRMRCLLNFYDFPVEWKLMRSFARWRGMRRASSQIDALRGYGGTHTAGKAAIIALLAADMISDGDFAIVSSLMG